jgi:hypothetical protein
LGEKQTAMQKSATIDAMTDAEGEMELAGQVRFRERFR